MQNVLSSGKRRYKHDKRTFGQMEIGYKRVNAFERIARIDENICPPGACLHCSVCFCKAFERAA